MKILKSLDPHYLIHRMATDQIVGVLADQDLGFLAGPDMLLADGEVEAGAEPEAHAVVQIRKGVRFASGEVAVQKLGEKLDPFMARTFGTSTEPVWFHPLASVEQWEESAVVKGLEVPVRIQKSAVASDEASLRELSAEDLGTVAKMLDSHADLDGAEELVEIVKAEYDHRGLEVDESLQIFKGLWGYPAGKAALSKKLAAMMPVHKVYVEPFVGSGAVLFAKEKAATEVVNDTNQDVADAWRILTKLTEEQTKKLAAMNWTGDRSTYEKMLKGSASGDLAKLHRFLYMSRFSYGGMRTRRFDPSAQGKELTMPQKLEKNVPRVHGVRVSCEDYEAICRKYDGPDTMHFLDPPYVGTNTHVGEPDFDEARFFKMLTELKGKWIVTYGVKGDLPKMLRASKFTVKTVETNRSIRAMRGTTDEAKLKQIIAYNYELPKVEKAVWSTAFQNDLPDSSFLYIEPGGEKDEEGKTVPRTLRYFPVRDAAGKLDLPHVRNAIARIPQSTAPGLDAADKARLQDKARALLEEIKKKLAGEDAEKQDGAQAPVLCFYHRDLDGVASAAVVAQAHPEAELVGITYGEDFPWDTIKGREAVYMVDFGLQPFEDMVKLKAALDEQGTKFMWIDHHATALEAAEKASFEAEGLRKIGDAGCELTWKFLHPDEPVPEVVRLAGRFDVWDHGDENVVPVHYAMEALEEANDPSSEWWSEWLQKGADDFAELVAMGKSIAGWLEQFNAGRMRHSAFDVEFGGLKCVAACTSIPGSLQFESVRGEHDAAVAFNYSPGNQWDVSLYGLKDEVDVGKVCADHGGGGHQGAGGFQCKELPFDLPVGTAKAYDLREPLAAYAHDAWSRWMEHLFSKVSAEGVIASDEMERRKRQMATAYADLTEEEKESDREEADKMLAVMSGRGEEPVEKADPSAPVSKNFAPVLPGDKNSFDDVNALLKDFVTDELLVVGLGVAAKWSGEVAVVHAAGGKVILTIGSDAADKSGAFPEIVAAASKIGENFVLVGDLLGSGSDARLVVRDVLHWGDKDPATDPWEARQKILSQVLPQAVGPIVLSPVRIVHALDRLKAAITWASEIPGSEGAVITVANSTSDPGGPSSSVAEVRMARIVNALVVGADSNEGESRAYHCVVGPLSDSDSNRMKDVVEIGGRNYTPIGSTSPTSVEASEGNVLRVEVGEILVVDSTESATVGWITSKVLERVHVKPATVPEIRALARPHEIQKLCKIIKRDPERHYILSVVLEPNDGDDGAPLDPDAHDEIYSDDEIWDACVYWYEQGSQIGVMHERETTTKEMLPVHNFIAPADMVVDGEKVRAGTWLIGSLVLSADLWRRIDSGELNAWSVDGRALRRPEAIAA